MSENGSMAELAKALAAAQGEMPEAAMDSVNPFLKNKYASLGAIIKAARPVLAKHGLSVIQLPYCVGDRIGVQTIILHSSGAKIETAIDLPMGEEKGKSLAQVAGSIISYLRRYSFASALAIYADEDTDGNEPTRKSEPPKHQDKPAKSNSGRSWPGDLITRAKNELGETYKAPQHIVNALNLPASPFRDVAEDDLDYNEIIAWLKERKDDPAE